jgi:hypothetical protein
VPGWSRRSARSAGGTDAALSIKGFASISECERQRPGRSVDVRLRFSLMSMPASTLALEPLGNDYELTPEPLDLRLWYGRGARQQVDVVLQKEVLIVDVGDAQHYELWRSEKLLECWGS